MKKKYLIIFIFFIQIFICSCLNFEIASTKYVNSTDYTANEAEKITYTFNYNCCTNCNRNLTVNDSTYNLNNKSSEKNITIVLDPGHSNVANLEKEPIAPESLEMKIKDGGGAIGVLTNTRESDINLNVALKLRDLLKNNGYNVVMTKTKPTESLGNIERAEIGNKESANLVLRIHCDSNDDESCYGASMLVPKVINENTQKIYDESSRCGKIILDSLCEYIPIYNRGIICTDQMTGFNWSCVPVVLIEMGFLSNPDEDELLSSNDYEEKLSNGLFLGIKKCFE